ncbi:hypothetical protein GCM10023085_33400 [Actinomadura viridis]
MAGMGIADRDAHVAGLEGEPDLLSSAGPCRVFLGIGDKFGGDEQGIVDQFRGHTPAKKGFVGMSAGGGYRSGHPGEIESTGP